ncbi:MAG: ribonuclease HI [Verrucomicrobiota bacterium]
MTPNPDTTLPEVIVHTDGGCWGNPGPGAWACVVQYGAQWWQRAAAVPCTTNNRMEIQAAIQALRALNQPCAVRIHTDSDYLRQGITSWIHGWRKRGWVTATREPVKNRDLWQELDDIARVHRVDWRWVRGHNGDRWNELCDQLATQAIERLVRETPKADLAAAKSSFMARSGE